MSDRTLSHEQLHLFGVLRQADELWLPLWLLAKRCGYSARKTTALVRELRRRGLVVKRAAVGLSSVEVSLTRGGIA